MGEEIDYMSDSIIGQCDDIRPGVCKTRTAARSIFLDAKRQTISADSKRQSKRNRTVTTEQERTLRALEKPLDDCNRGFKMLVKMGFQPGAALGKRKDIAAQVDGDEVHDDQTPQTSSSAIKEPIKIDLKHDRKGLGHGTREKEKLLALEKSRKIQHQHQLILSRIYDQCQKDKAKFKTLTKELHALQKICYELDSRNDVPKPTKVEFWPRYAQQVEENDEEIEQQDDEKAKNENDYQYLISSTMDMSVEINQYLREKYFYCSWCAIQYEDEDDMKHNCPGPAEPDHDYDSLDD